MVLYLCHLTLHDNLFFASREMGTLYETEKYLHNWALSYALFECTHIPRPYRLEGENTQRPGYLDADNEQNLLHLNKAGIYVFPALPLRCFYQINTFKASQSAYYSKSRKLGEKGNDLNFPVYGRIKELATGSKYRTFIIAPKQTLIPQWIRLGKWASKIRVEVYPIPSSQVKRASGSYTCDHPLNPLDLPASTQLQLYNRIVMPPVSLISQAKLSGSYWEISTPSTGAKSAEEIDEDLPAKVYLPRGVAYGASATIATP